MLERLYADGNVNWYSHYGEDYRSSLRKPKNRIPYDPTTPLPSIYTEKIIILKDTWTPMFTALFTIARTWKQHKCPSTEEWIKKIWYIYTVQYYLAIEKDKIMPHLATWINLDSKWSKSKKNIIQYHLYVESKRMIEMKLLTKQK